MKTNVPIELNNEQRLILGQKYNKTTNKQLLTRKEVNEITQTFFQLLLESDTNIRKTSKEIIESGEWNKVYYIKGKRVSEDRFNQEKDHPRKFYGYGKGERS